MVWARRFWLKLQSLFRRSRSTQRLDDEIQFHLEQQIVENLAVRKMMRDFGGGSWPPKDHDLPVITSRCWLAGGLAVGRKCTQLCY